MPAKRYSNLIGFDDAPFPRGYSGPVKLVGAVFAGTRFDGVVVGQIEKDGADSTDEIVRLVGGTRFAEHVQLVVLQGIAVGGFNVVDALALQQRLGLPVLVVARKQPDMASIRRALLSRVPGGLRKWELVEKLGPMESQGDVWIQRVGITPAQAASVIERFAIHSRIPEPLRVAHLIAGALAVGQSHGRP
jgi:uncharacterized protein